MAPIPCFWLERTDRVRQSLRRFTYSKGEPDSCPTNPKGYGHEASVQIEDAPLVEDDHGYVAIGDDFPHDDPRWTTHCACGYAFQDTDNWQRFVDPIYRRVDTSEELTLQNPPPGAMWDAYWMSDFWKGPDGRSLTVQTPGGHGASTAGPITAPCPMTTPTSAGSATASPP